MRKQYIKTEIEQDKKQNIIKNAMQNSIKNRTK